MRGRLSGVSIAAAGRCRVTPMALAGLLAVVLSTAGPGVAAAPPTEAPPPTAGSSSPRDNDIHEVVEAFRTAILRRDRERFLALFVEPTAAWQSVLTDQGLAQVRRTSPTAIKARFKAQNNAVAFIDEIVRSEAPSEETFSNLRVDSDGDLASVSFAYRFLSGGVVKNHGTEQWLLVRTEAGWKISAIAYSVTLGAPASTR